MATASPGPDPDAINQTVLETDRLLLRPPSESAVRDLYDLVAGDAGRAVTDRLVWDGPGTLQDLLDFAAAGSTRSFDEWGHHWYLHDRHGSVTGRIGRAIGAIGLTRGNHAAAADLGFWLGEPYWGRGLMTEAVGAVGHAFATMRFLEIGAGVFVGNVASAAVLRRVGFQPGRTIERALVKRGEPVDVMLFGLTAARWNERRGSAADDELDTPVHGTALFRGVVGDRSRLAETDGDEL